MTNSPTLPAQPADLPRPFDAEELTAFEKEDLEAGRIIGGLLCFFFVYTIIVTLLAAWWTHFSLAG